MSRLESKVLIGLQPTHTQPLGALRLFTQRTQRRLHLVPMRHNLNLLALNRVKHRLRQLHFIGSTIHPHEGHAASCNRADPADTLASCCLTIPYCSRGQTQNFFVSLSRSLVRRYGWAASYLSLWGQGFDGHGVVSDIAKGATTLYWERAFVLNTLPLRKHSSFLDTHG